MEPMEIEPFNVTGECTMHCKCSSAALVRKRHRQPFHIVQPSLQVAMATPLLGAPAQQGMSPALALLQRVDELQVKERVSWLQEITTFLGAEIETRNRYAIQDGIGNQLFYAIERTDCCRRQLQRSCLHECASWEVDVLHTPPGQYMQRFLSMRRPMQCVCCCFCRPTAEVFDDLTRQKLGSFRDPCRCCNYNFKLRDAYDTDVLEVHGGCCQPAVWCPLPCGPCANLQFDVLDAHTGAKVASITKQVPGLLAFMFASDVDNYHIQYDLVQDPAWKALLLSFTIYMDFLFFNNPNPGSEEEAWAADMVMADETTCCFGLRKTHEGTGNMAASISAKCFVGTLESMTKVSKGRDVEDLALACTKLTDRTPALQLRFQWR
ncbi:unnamed protein product [Effrenium voratum]|nr:unnamed protein product [Effrenium voratum]